MGRCPICYENKSVSIQTLCGHTFCLRCMFMWILQCIKNYESISCPMCRAMVRISRLKWRTEDGKRKFTTIARAKSTVRSFR